MSQLSAASGVPVATIKYYLRERLLHSGRPTARNQAEYDDTHLQRIRLVRVLIDVGGLPIAAVRDVVEALESPRRSLPSVVGVVHHALTPRDAMADGDDLRAARSEVDAWIAELGWRVTERAPARRTLAEALVSLRRLGRDTRATDFAKYADAAARLAAWELKSTAARAPASKSELVESVVIGTVVYESVLLALRRLAQEHEFARTAALGKL